MMVLRRGWYDRYRWAVLALGGAAAVGAVLAEGSGESLEERIRATEGAEAARAIHDHAEAGELAEILTILFLLALAAFVLVPWYLDRRAARQPAGRAEVPTASSTGPSWLRPAMSVVVVIAAAASLFAVVRAGHSGASQAWDDYDTSVSVDG